MGTIHNVDITVMFVTLLVVSISCHPLLCFRVSQSRLEDIITESPGWPGHPTPRVFETPQHFMAELVTR